MPTRGVNLGNWLVLEKWMSPDLFAGTAAEDEYHLWRELSPEVSRERLKAHRDSWVTDRDFQYLAANGVELIRIPVPYFVFGDHAPYVGCVEYLDRAFTWAGRHGQQILIDLHTVPDSQNGFDNGGICGVCKFHTKPENVAVALDVLEQLTARYGHHPALWGIEVLNEPISPELWEAMDIPSRYPAVDREQAAGSEGVPTEFLTQFYRDAYQRIRAKAPDVRVVFHDGFRVEPWAGFFTGPDFENVVLDTHLYLMMHTWTEGETDLAGYLSVVDDTFVRPIRDAASHLPVMIGEWCVDTASTEPVELAEDDRRRYHRAIAEAQLRAWAPTVAWCYWSYKIQSDERRLEPWDMGRVIEAGWLPADRARAR